jgi:hypothetical protein
MRIPVLLLAVAVAVAAAAESIEKLAFMRGCWAFDSANGHAEEHWTAPAGGTMLGVSRTVAEGKTVFTEYAQVREESGKIVMLVQLGLAQRQTTFRLASLNGQEAVFTSELEFPRRLIYRLEKNGSLFARTEGTRKGQSVAEDYPYKATECR